MNPVLDPEIQRTVDAYINGLSGQAPELSVDREFLEMEENIDLWMLHYFPRDFTTWEPLNQMFIDFLENNRYGTAWLPGGHGKTTTLLRWQIRVMCVEPQIAFIYVEKTEPTAMSRSRAIMAQLEGNKKLIHDYGEFVGANWSVANWTIAQRPEISDWPTYRVFGTGGAALGNRCNIINVDDPVTTHNSASEADRRTIFQWWTEAASTCPSPLPLRNPKSKYLKKEFLDGTTFHMDDLYHRVQAADPERPMLHVKAVDLATHETLSRRFDYVDMDELRREADVNEAAHHRLRNIEDGRVENLLDFRKKKGIVAFNRRYQNEVIDPEAQKFAEVWFRGGTDEFALEGGYPGCLDKDRSLGERYDGWRYVTGYDPASGSTTKSAARSVIVTLGADPKDPATIYLADINYGYFPMELDNELRRTQLGLICDHVRRYNSRVALETNNIQKAVAGTIRAYCQRKGLVVSIQGHWTTKQGKIDPEMGVEAMAPMIENGKLVIPYREPSDKKVAEEIINEFTGYPDVYPTKDIVMAIWFAWRVLKKQLKINTQQHEPPQRPAYMDWDKHQPSVIFPDQWTQAQIDNYLNGTPPQEDDDEEEML